MLVLEILLSSTPVKLCFIFNAHLRSEIKLKNKVVISHLHPAVKNMTGSEESLNRY